MSFEIKYDKDGNVLTKPADLPQVPEAAVVQQQAPALEEILQEPAVPEEVEVQQEQPVIEEKPRSQQPQNFKEMREAIKRIEKERDEALRLAQEIQSKIQQNTPDHTHEDIDDDSIQLAPDDIAEGKHLAKMAKKVQKLEAEVNRYKTQSSESLIEAKIKATYPDFDSVVSKENVEMLRTLYPEIAQTLNASADLYSKAVSAYTLIKKFGITPEDNYEKQKAVIAKNAAKPKPLTSIAPQQGESPLSRANVFADGLTDELRTQLLKEMNSARKNI